MYLYESQSPNIAEFNKNTLIIAMQLDIHMQLKAAQFQEDSAEEFI
jgi:hypothetical protein